MHYCVVFCRGYRDHIPELDEDFGGVQHAELFVAGDVLAANLMLGQVAEMSR